jgi:TctA family transporter
VLLEAGYTALSQMLQVQPMLYLLIGVAVGLVVGIIPGIGATAGMGILLPVVYGMDLYSGMPLLIGIAATTSISDTFPSVLIGVPGTAAGQASIIDGHEMARQGLAARALGAAFTANAIGGVTGALLMLGLLWIAKPVILSFGSPELLMLSLFGLATVSVVVQGDMLKCLIVAAVGLFLGAVGTAPAAPVDRFTFGTDYLEEGISLVVLILGLFAIPEILHMMATGERIADRAEMRGRMRDGVRDALRNAGLAVRSWVIGVVLGMVPGAGSATTQWAAYAAAKYTVRDGRFGAGDVRGVIAPESAVNATDGGALVPTLSLGIPVSGSMAVFMGGLVLLGVQPGPRMLTDQLPLSLSIVWSFALANLLGVALCLMVARQIARLTFVRGRLLGPILLVIITAAAFQTRYSWGDILTLVACGAVGTAMVRYDWPRVPMLIGFVLSQAVERYLTLSVSRYGAVGWLADPLVIALAAAIVLLVGASLWHGARSRRRAPAGQPVEQRS